MARMRGVAPFEELWERRSTLNLPGGLVVEVMGLPDLVRAKMTQRDKDWPMIRRLIEADYFAAREAPSPRQVEFWLLELRSPELLAELAGRHPDELRTPSARRPEVPDAAARGDLEGIGEALKYEEERERALDRAYWKPLLEELSTLRRRR